MTLPLVSVYIPTFNRLQLLKRAVDSVLKQVYSNIEIIIVDDCSSDGTDAYLHGLATERSNVRYFKNESNEGACVSRNKAIANAKGEYITGLDDDDYFTPERISDFIQIWGKKGSHTIALTSSRLRVISSEHSEYLAGEPLLTLDQMYLRNLVGSQVFTQTKTVQSLGGFDANLGAWQDYELILRLLQIGDIENTMNYTYIVDVSHPHERISTANYAKVEAACAHVIKKHSLVGRRALELESQLLVYRFSYSRAAKLVSRFLLQGNLKGTKAVLMRFYRAKLTRSTRST
jgi:glycosyltransferase involved in cell wall biosynthesis